MLDSHIITPSSPLPPSFLHHLALGSPLDEISNSRDSVRHHIFHHGKRDRATNKLQQPMLFFVYQTGRYGPQNGFRLCLVHEGYEITSPRKEEGEEQEQGLEQEGVEDEIERLEREIPQGLMEVVVLGELSEFNPGKVEEEEREA